MLHGIAIEQFPRKENQREDIKKRTTNPQSKHTISSVNLSMAFITDSLANGSVLRNLKRLCPEPRLYNKKSLEVERS